MKYIAIAVGGSIGALLRYMISNFVNNLFPFAYIPWGSIVVNTMGSFLLSFIMFSVIQKIEIPSIVIYFFSVGLLGAFTTFSTFTYEFFTMVEESIFRGFLYFFITISFGFGAAYLGFLISKF